ILPGEAAIWATFRDKADRCGADRIAERRREMWGAFMMQQASGLGGQQDLGGLMQQVSGMMGQGAGGGAPGLMQLAPGILGGLMN
ncbi:MAG: hypothetical protein FWC83_01270, partial [Alphaproteobacteria bacterium]|nr:hypothetical protein [Alphaproteobacteria bacterium]